MSYNIGASPSQVDAERAVAESKAVLLAQFDKFAAIVTQGAADIESGSLISFQAGNPALAKAMRDSIPRLRAGMDNVLAGKVSADVWSSAVSRLVKQVREEAPWFSVTKLSSAGDSLITAVKMAASATAAAAAAAAAAAGTAASKVVVAAGETAGKTIKAAAEGAGLDVQKTVEEASSTIKYVAVAGGLLAVAYLAFILPKPGRK